MSGVETVHPGASLAAGGVQWSDSTGTALVRPDGSNVSMREGAMAPQDLGLLPFMPTTDTSLWTADKTAALTVEVDSVVTFNGLPTIKITIPAGTSGTIKVGTSGANCRIPYGWDKDNAMFASMSSNTACVENGSFYLGDAGYSNFWACGEANDANFPQWKLVANEWKVSYPVAANWSVLSGSPAVASMMRMKWQATATSVGTDTYYWIGFVGAMPRRKLPTIIWTIDDGYASWYSFVAPLFKHYKMPVSMGIARDFVGSGGFLTVSQIQELFADRSKLFDIVNHSVDNNTYATLGASAYAANVSACLSYLRSLGITGDGPLHHPLVQSLWGNDLLPLLASAGILSARGSAYSVQGTKDQALALAKQRYVCGIATNLQTGKSFSQAQTDITAVITANGFGMINAHDFAASAGAYIWDYDSMEKLVGWLAAQRDAGLCEVKSWSRWWADNNGRITDRV